MVEEKLNVLVFGIGKDIMGGSKVALELAVPISVDKFKVFLLNTFPDFKDVRSLAIAINNQYSSGEDLIQKDDEVAIIPPVSGG